MAGIDISRLNGYNGGLTGINAMNSLVVGSFFGGSGSIGGTDGMSFLNGINNRSWSSEALSDWGNRGKNISPTSESAKEYISDIKSVSGDLLAASDKMTSKYPPLFKTLMGSLDNSKTLEVKSVNNAVVNTGKTLNVDVQQIAMAQKNVGNRVDSAAKPASSGTFAFDITVGGETHNLNVKIEEGDNNLTAQMRVADAINKKGIGLNAFVSHDTKTGESFLTIQSEKTGANADFQIADRTENGLISSLGADRVDVQAQDARYSVNGGAELSSAANDVSLGNGITATLKEAGTAKVGVKTDTDTIMSGVKDFINGYNELLKTAKAYNSTGSDKIVDQLTKAYKSYSAGLAGVGIKADSNGYLSIDEDKAKSSIENGSMARAMGASGYSATGFSAAVKQTARSVNSTPNIYLGATKTDAGNSSGYGSSFSYNSAYGNNLYGSMTGYGLLYSGLF
ncbi:MAG: flagellar filament capping protein FliD [Clostridiales bacterium]|jgi:flagellar capping protein FliD|nr:flagellar filament capping protein FliD [Clostridiales bacterium]